MIVKNLVLQNFMSHALSTINLENRGLVFVEGDNQDTGGSNGAGKSAIFDGLRWGIFGEVSRDVKKTAVDRNGKGDCNVYVNLDVDGIDVKIYRYRDHSTYGNKVLVYLNDVNKTLGTNSETQCFINSTLGINDLAFCSAVMFPQGSSGFSSLTDRDQKEILDGILKTNRFSDALERAKAAAQSIENQISSISVIINLAERDIVNKTQQYEQLTAQHQEFEIKKARRVAELEDLLKATLAMKPTIDINLESEIARLSAIPSKASADSLTTFTNLSHKIKEVSRSLSLTEGKLSSIPVVTVEGPPPSPPVRSSSEYVVEIETLKSRIKSLEVSLAPLVGRSQTLSEELSVINTGVCPTCNQPLGASSKMLSSTSKKNELAKLNFQIDELSKLLKIAYDELQIALDFQSGAVMYETWLDNLEHLKARKDLEDKLQGYKNSLAALEKSKADLELLIYEDQKRRNQIESLKQELEKQTRKLDEWYREQYKIQQMIDAKKAETSPALSIIRSLDIENTIANLKKSVALQSDTARELEYKLSCYQFWIKGFGNQGIRNYVIDNNLPFLNLRISDYMSMLSNETANVVVNSQKQLASGESRDKISVAIQNPFGANVYGGSSGGERRRIDIATLFALGDLAALQSNTQVELRLLDEPFESLDSVGNEQVVRLLNSIVVPRSKTVLVMSHDDSLKSLFPSSIKVVKKNGISRIEE